jgi:hypothetical protein
MGLLGRSFPKNVAIRYQNDDGHPRPQSLSFSGDQSGLGTVIVEINDDRIDCLLSAPRDALIPDARTEYIPATLLQRAHSADSNLRYSAA